MPLITLMNPISIREGTSGQNLLGYAPNRDTALQITRALTKRGGVYTLKPVAGSLRIDTALYPEVSATWKGRKYHYGYYGDFESGLVAEALSQLFKYDPPVNVVRLKASAWTRIPAPTPNPRT